MPEDDLQQQLQVAVGREGDWTLPNDGEYFSVRVQVLDFRVLTDRTVEWLVTPMNGRGEKWVGGDEIFI